MKLAVKKIDALRRELKFEIPKDRVSKKLEEVFNNLSKVAKVKGFRQGKAPRNVLEAEHGELAREETIKKLIPEVYQEGLAKENLLPMDLPDIQDVNFKDGVITFTACIDIKPDIKVKSYKGIKVTRKSSKVTEEEIEKTMEYFKKSQGKEKETVIDDEFVKGLGFPNLNEFKQSLVRQMEIDKDRQNRIDVENQVVEYLLKESKLLVPQSLVKKQLEHRLHEAKHHFEQQGMPAEDIERKLEELKKNLSKPVERDVKIYLIFGKIAELEGIQAGEKESLPLKVMEFLLREASWQESK